MLLYKQYIDFRLLCKRLMSNKSSNLGRLLSKLDGLIDINLKIWEFYQKIIATDIISKFVFQNTIQCTDCFTINWKINPHNKLNNFYRAPSCNIESFDFTDTCCCEKYICKHNCYFNIECEECGIILYNYNLPRSDNDQGWNPIEGKNDMIIPCWKCEHQNKIQLTMKYCETSSCLILGKLVSNNNRYMIKNNYRIIVNNKY